MANISGVLGCDISEFQPNWKPTSPYEYVFARTSFGMSHDDAYHKQHVSHARAANMVVGHYHFLRPGNIQAQAEKLVKLADLKPGEMLACDWEPWEESLPTCAEKDQFIRAVKKLAPGHKVGLYCDESRWLYVDTTGYYGDFLWIADPDVAKPGIQAPWIFWQYSWSDGLDKNRSSFTSAADLRTWAAGTKAAVSVTTTTTPVNPTLDKIRVPYGQKGSMWSKGYHTGDDWHRNAGLAEIGDDIVAVADGTVIYADDATKTDAGWGRAFGKHVLITWDHKQPGETVARTSIDAHMSKIIAKAGQHVTAGTVIGKKGQTGNVTGPHDHHQQNLGPRWTDQDVKPVYPGQSVTTSTPVESKEDDDMARDRIAATRTMNQPAKKAGQYQTLWTTNSTKNKAADCTVGWGPCEVDVDVYLLISGLKPGQRVYLRPYTVDYVNGKPVRNKGSEGDPQKITNDTDGWQWGPNVHFSLIVGAPDKKATSRRLRFEWISPDNPNVQIERSVVTGWSVKK